MIKSLSLAVIIKADRDFKERFFINYMIKSLSLAVIRINDLILYIRIL